MYYSKEITYTQLKAVLVKKENTQNLKANKITENMAKRRSSSGKRSHRVGGGNKAAANQANKAGSPKFKAIGASEAGMKGF